MNRWILLVVPLVVVAGGCARTDDPGSDVPLPAVQQPRVVVAPRISVPDVTYQPVLRPLPVAPAPVFTPITLPPVQLPPPITRPPVWYDYSPNGPLFGRTYVCEPGITPELDCRSR